MLTLITGHRGTDNSAHVTAAIEQDLAAGRRVYLIVPEQQTVSVERGMANRLPPSAPLSFEVVNFTRLADTVFRMHGGLATEACSGAAEQLTMWRVLTEASVALHNRIEAEPKNVDKMRRIMKELRAMCLSPALLREAAVKSEGNLHDKLEDYALISSLYHDTLTELAGDSADHIDRLAELLMAHPFPDGTRFYIDNFSSFTEQEYNVIDALLHHADVTITLCVPKHNEIQLSAAEVDGTRTALLRIATRCQSGLEIRVLAEDDTQTKNARDYIAEHLFRVDYTKVAPYSGKAEDDLRLIECADPLDACDYIAADIRRRVMTEDCRYRDFTVVCGAAQNYTGLLDASFEKYDVPFFFSRGQDMLALEPVKMLLLAYAVIDGGWRHEDVIAYLKCAPLGITQDVCDELELYCETWNIHGERWYDGITWNMNPFGYGTPHSAGQRTYAQEKLSRVNAARDTLVPPLATLATMRKGRHTVGEHICALTEFLLTLSYPDYLNRRAEELMSRDRAAAAEYARLWNVLCDAMDTMTHVLGDMHLTTEEFAAQLKMLFGAQKIGAIPAGIDEVTVAEARMLRTGDVKHAYLLGANEGEFPPPPADDIAFTEQERQILAALDAKRTDDTNARAARLDDVDARAARELYAFWRAMNMASDSVTVLWSRAGISLEAVTPADPVLRIRHLLGAEYPVTQITPADLIASATTAAAAGERVGHAAGTVAGAALRLVLGEDARYLGDILALDEPLCNDNRALSPSLAAELWQGDLAMTQSRVQKFKECPFSYFCSYVLRLDKAEPAEFNTGTVGTFIHAVLEHFFALVKERGLDVHALSPETQEELLREVSDAVVSSTLPAGEENVPRTQVLLKSLGQCAAATVAALCEEFSHSRFEPSFFELSIGEREEGNPAPVTFDLPDGHKIYIYGSIDRVDTYREGDAVYIRVIDYKTGVKKFKLEDIEEGINLQLLLYLFSILETDSAAFRERLGISRDGDILPAAVLYLSSLTAGNRASVPQNEEEAKILGMKVAQRSGLILDDRDIISAMDDTPGNKYLPITITKTGEYDKRSIQNVTNIVALGELKTQIGATLSELGATLKQGDASAAPMQRRDTKSTACEWCNFKAICRYTAPDTKKTRGGGQITVKPDTD